MPWLLALHGRLLCVRQTELEGWCVDVAVYEDVELRVIDRFCTARSATLHTLVAAACVLDVHEGSVVPILAFASADGDASTRYTLLHLDAEARALAPHDSFLSPAGRHLRALLADGPTLCVLCALPHAEPLLTVAARGAAPRSVAVPSRARVLCACGEPSAQRLLLLLRAEGGGAYVAAVDLEAQGQLALRPLGARAVEDLGAEVCCIAPWWAYDLARRGAAGRSLRLWVATSAAMLHLCSLDAAAPLSSAQLAHPPLRLAPLPLQYGPPLAAVLFASKGHTLVQLLSTRGEVLREVRGADGWVAHDFLGAAHPQLLLFTPRFSSAHRRLEGYMLIGVHATYADLRAEGEADGAEARGGARRSRLRGVACGLARRVAAGREAVDGAERQAAEVRLLRQHATELLRCEAERSPHAAGEARSERSDSLLQAWSRAAGLQLLVPTHPPPPPLTHPLPSTPLPSSPPPHTSSTHPVPPPAARPRLISLEHSFAHRHWLLRAHLSNDGARACAHLCLCAAHPRLSLRAAGGGVRRLAAGGGAWLTLAVPLEALLGGEALCLPLVLCWREAGEWRHLVAANARLPAADLFEASLRAPPPSAPNFPLPPALHADVSLLFTATPSAQLDLQELLRATLRLEEEGGGGEGEGEEKGEREEEREEGEQREAEEEEEEAAAKAEAVAEDEGEEEERGCDGGVAREVWHGGVMRGRHGVTDVRLEARVLRAAGGGRVQLRAAGVGAEAVLHGALCALHRALPCGVAMGHCYASSQLAAALRRVVSAMLAEVAALKRECEAARGDAPLAAEWSGQLQRSFAALQAATDEEVALLHTLLE